MLNILEHFDVAGLGCVKAAPLLLLLPLLPLLSDPVVSSYGWNGLAHDLMMMPLGRGWGGDFDIVRE
jgi:hypothetical protein